MKNIEAGKENSPLEASIEHNSRILDRDLSVFMGIESVGGNAGTVELDGQKYACGAATLWVDRASAEILMIANVQRVPLSVEQEAVEITLRVAFDRNKQKFFKIVETIGLEQLDQSLHMALEQSISNWNDKQKTQ